MTMGGYSATHVSHEHFTFKIPDGVPLAATSPILCAGATMYDPLR
jgi:D-arabinose 1-dehydrogenase-like Zn-dependent alcohol dehydrogenase